MKYHVLIATALAATTALNAHAAPAEKDWLDASRFQVRGRVIGVVPDESSNVTAGGSIKAGNAITPEVDLSYFITDHIAAEVIAGTSQHSVSHNTVGDLGRTWVLPPTLTLQYHFTPDAKLSPYMGAGVNYSLFYGEEHASGNGIDDLQLEGGWGYTFQAGADYWLNDRWGFNLDVKKVMLNVDASVNNGAVRADIDLDPWIVGAGVSYRF